MESKYNIGDVVHVKADACYINAPDDLTMDSEGHMMKYLDKTMTISDVVHTRKNPPRYKLEGAYEIIDGIRYTWLWAEQWLDPVFVYGTEDIEYNQIEDNELESLLGESYV